jgi:hypothetical protein
LVTLLVKSCSEIMALPIDLNAEACFVTIEVENIGSGGLLPPESDAVCRLRKALHNSRSGFDIVARSSRARRFVFSGPVSFTHSLRQSFGPPPPPEGEEL